MIDFMAVARGVAGGIAIGYGGSHLKEPILRGDTYDSRLQRTSYAAAAGLVGLGLACASPALLPALAGASTTKTLLATTALTLITPSVISRIWNGDQAHRARLGVEEGGPYSSFFSRLIGHASEAALAASVLYLTTDNPGTAAAITYTARSAISSATTTSLSLSWRTATTAVNLTRYVYSAASTAASTAAVVVNGLANVGKGLLGFLF